MTSYLSGFGFGFGFGEDERKREGVKIQPQITGPTSITIWDSPQWAAGYTGREVNLSYNVIYLPVSKCSLPDNPTPSIKRDFC